MCWKTLTSKVKYDGASQTYTIGNEVIDITRCDDMNDLVSKIFTALNAFDLQQGASAYEIAVQNGFVGTEQEWLDSLKGQDGAPGAPGAPGQDGINGFGPWGVSDISFVLLDYIDSNNETVVDSGQIPFLYQKSDNALRIKFTHFSTFLNGSNGFFLLSLNLSSFLSSINKQLMWSPDFAFQVEPLVNCLAENYAEVTPGSFDRRSGFFSGKVDSTSTMELSNLNLYIPAIDNALTFNMEVVVPIKNI